MYLNVYAIYQKIAQCPHYPLACIMCVDTTILLYKCTHKQSSRKLLQHHTPLHAFCAWILLFYCIKAPTHRVHATSSQLASQLQYVVSQLATSKPCTHSVCGYYYFTVPRHPHTEYTQSSQLATASTQALDYLARIPAVDTTVLLQYGTTFRVHAKWLKLYSSTSLFYYTYPCCINLKFRNVNVLLVNDVSKAT